MENLNFKVLVYVPNIIGYARILLTLTSFVLLGLQLPGWFVIAYAAAIILDGFDGYFARKLGQCSQFGAWLASTVSALEWTVFVCNHQLGDDWRHRVTEPPNSGREAASNGHRAVAQACAVNGAEAINVLLAGTPKSYCDQRKTGHGKYQELCDGHYGSRHNRRFTEDCKEDISYREKNILAESSTLLDEEEAVIADCTSLPKCEREDNSKNGRPPHLVQWIMKNNFRSVGGVWAIAGLHVLPLWLVGLKYGVFATSLHFLPSLVPIIGVLVLGAGRLLCGVAEAWCIWLHVKALITSTEDKSGQNSFND